MNMKGHLLLLGMCVVFTYGGRIPRANTEDNGDADNDGANTQHSEILDSVDDWVDDDQSTDELSKSGWEAFGDAVGPAIGSQDDKEFLDNPELNIKHEVLSDTESETQGNEEHSELLEWVDDLVDEHQSSDELPDIDKEVIGDAVGPEIDNQDNKVFLYESEQEDLSDTESQTQWKEEHSEFLEGVDDWVNDEQSFDQLPDHGKDWVDDWQDLDLPSDQLPELGKEVLGNVVNPEIGSDDDKDFPYDPELDIKLEVLSDTESQTQWEEEHSELLEGVDDQVNDDQSSDQLPDLGEVSPEIGSQDDLEVLYDPELDIKQGVLHDTESETEEDEGHSELLEGVDDWVGDDQSFDQLPDHGKDWVDDWQDLDLPSDQLPELGKEVLGDVVNPEMGSDEDKDFPYDPELDIKLEELSDTESQTQWEEEHSEFLEGVDDWVGDDQSFDQLPDHGKEVFWDVVSPDINAQDDLEFLYDPELDIKQEVLYDTESETEGEKDDSELLDWVDDWVDDNHSSDQLPNLGKEVLGDEVSPEIENQDIKVFLYESELNIKQDDLSDTESQTQWEEEHSEFLEGVDDWVNDDQSSDQLLNLGKEVLGDEISPEIGSQEDKDFLYDPELDITQEMILTKSETQGEEEHSELLDWMDNEEEEGEARWSASEEDENMHDKIRKQINANRSMPWNMIETIITLQETVKNGRLSAFDNEILKEVINNNIFGNLDK